MVDVSEKFPRVDVPCEVLCKTVSIFSYCRQLEQSVLANLEEICLSPHPSRAMRLKAGPVDNATRGWIMEYKGKFC